MVLRCLLLLWWFGCATALAGTATTRDSLERLGEVLELRLEDGRLRKDQVLPAILVSAQPRYEESADWYGTGAVETLQTAFGAGNLRLCEACMAPRAYVEEGHMVFQTGPIGLDEVIRLDEQARGEAQPARSAIWLDETRTGLSVRIVDLRTGGVMFARNVDPGMIEYARTQKSYQLAAELERRSKGRSLTQAFVDMTLYPGQHFSLDWTDQWGKRNTHFSGFTLSLFDPIVGVGACHYERVNFFNVLVGGKLIMSMPTAIGRAVAPDDFNDPIFDRMLTGVGVIRVPFGRSNYGAILTVSTNGRAGIGISLMNISLLPVLL